ncbi:hypothetical protein BGZ61DRAFT_450430 [Ilyonectria robusta]|uniref:uncharacterized protein n=1 Tax=Ilyonectria robusta TaxID=1079257 RepID=UPI001E8E5D0C|nr:uncharacterized protein BGZ61DRAFT_450430 [Ilyonectria robusta]KAH8706744.1 hypothetical protein BGZ61DRAFT_450430 [Ilyonectria robusta]
MPGWDLASATRRGVRARGQTLSSGEVRNVAGGIKYQLIGISNGRGFRGSRFSPVCVVVETGRMGHAWFRCRLGTQDGCILVMYWIFHVRLTDWKVGGIVEVPVGGVLKVSRDDKGQNTRATDKSCIHDFIHGKVEDHARRFRRPGLPQQEAVRFRQPRRQSPRGEL